MTLARRRYKGNDACNDVSAKGIAAAVVVVVVVVVSMMKQAKKVMMSPRGK